MKLVGACLVLLVLPLEALAGHGEGFVPHPLSAVPFILMLLAIAVLPLLHRTEHWWESNAHKGIVAAVLSIPVAAYLLLHDPRALEHVAIEYGQFLTMLFALFVIASGIHIRGNLVATPWVNLGILLVGYVVVSVVGTTGGSMVLIYFLLRTNKERRHVRHTVIFFIFMVANVGGLLSPLGDPPLFLAFLQGVDFWWFARNLWWVWMLSALYLSAAYMAMEWYWYRKEPRGEMKEELQAYEPMRLLGVWNLVLLAIVVVSVALKVASPLREGIMLGSAGLSLLYSRQNATAAFARRNNNFSFVPIVEVAVLFAGIFVTMVPALLLLNARGAELGVTSPVQYFWATGSFSSFLDNAPTLLVFLELGKATQGVETAPLFVDAAPHLFAAICVGAVYMGANTYIGNAPNFMILVVARQHGVKMPSFFGYILWSAFILLPWFLVVGILLQVVS